MMEWAAGVLALPIGYVVKRQLEINRQVAESKAAIDELKDDVTYTRDRVDAIYDHLIAERGPRKGRGPQE